MRRIVLLLGIFVLTGALAGCGNKGPLVRAPASTPAPAQTPAAAASSAPASPATAPTPAPVGARP